MPPVDILTFLPEQKQVFNRANALGSGVPTVNNPITTEDLAFNEAPIRVPPVTPINPQEYQSDTASALKLTEQQIASLQNQRTTAETTQSNLVNEILSTLQQGQGREQAQLEAEQRAGIPEQQKRLQELTGRLTQLQNEALAIPLQIQEDFAGTGATRGGVEPVQTARLRQNAIQSLTIGAQAQALQGNIALAQKQVNRAVDLQFKPIEDRLQFLTTAYSLNKDILEREDKQRAQQLEIALTERSRLLAFAKEEQTQKNELALLATQFGIDASSALNSGSYSEALNAVIPALSQVRGAEREIENLVKSAQLEGIRLSNQNAKLTARKIAAEIATLEDDELADDETTAEVEKALAVFTQAQKVLNMDGMKEAVGFGVKKSLIARTIGGVGVGAAGGAAAGLPFGGVGAIPGAIIGGIGGGVLGALAGPEAIRGSARADFEAEAKRLANLLTVDNLDLMSGVLSETDIKILESAGSILGDFDVSEELYVQELERVMGVARRNFTKMGLTAEQAQFYFGLSDQDINEVDVILGNETALTPGQFDPFSYYGARK